MKDKFSTIKYLSEETAPSNIRRNSLRRIKIIKLRPFIYTIASAFLINLLLLGNHVIQHIINSDALSVINVIIADFEFSADYIVNAFWGLKEVLPLLSSSLLMLNLVIVALLISFFQRYRAELLKI